MVRITKRLFDFIVKPWSLITYGFAHYGFYHLLINCVILYFVSRSLENLFPTKQSLNIYLLGILSGGLLFLLVYNLIPPNLTVAGGPLVGASAGVHAILIFLCVYMPYREARFFMITIKLWYIAVAIVVFDLFGLFTLNQGGSVAHFGGNILGYFYASQLQKGTDIGAGFGRLMDSVVNWFKPGSKLKTVHRNKKKPYAGKNKKILISLISRKRSILFWIRSVKVDTTA